MAYDFKVNYQPGALNSADYLSRSNPLTTKDKCSNLSEEYIHHLATQSLPKSLAIKQIAKSYKQRQRFTTGSAKYPVNMADKPIQLCILPSTP